MISWHEIPFLRILIPYILGVICMSYFEEVDTMFLIEACAIMSAFLFLLKRVSIHSLFFAVFCAVIFLLGCSRMNISKEQGFINRSDFEDKRLNIIGEVVNNPKYAKYLKIELKIKQIGVLIDSLSDESARIICFLETKDSIHIPKMGDRICIQAYLNPIQSNTNPYAFNYKQYMARQGIHYQVFCKPEDWAYARVNRIKSVKVTLNNIRLQSIEILRHYLPNDEHFGIASAMLLGYRDDLGEDLQNAYAETGAIHVLAVSGLHVGIVAYAFLWFLNLFKSQNVFWKIAKITIILFVIWIYAFLTGVAPSVFRAAIMFSILIVAKEWNGRTNIYNTIALSALIILMIDPQLIFHLGFLFSYLAVISIVFFQPIIYPIIKSRVWFIDKGWNLIAVALSAQIFVFPLTIYYFHKFPVYFWLSGLLVIPCALLVIYGGFLLLLLHVISPACATSFATIYKWIFDSFNGGIRFIHSLPFGKIDAIWCDQSLMLLLFVSLFFLLRWTYTRRFGWYSLLMFGACMNVTYISYQHYIRVQNNYLIFYDVNNGYAIDFFKGKNRWSVQSEKVSEKSVDFATKNNRIMQMATHSEDHNEWIYQDSTFLFFENKSFLLANDSNIHLAELFDFVVVDKKVDIPNSEKLKALFVLTRGLNFYEHRSVVDRLQELSLPYYSIKNEGALTINFNHEK